MRGTIENGRREDVAFGTYAGLAGVIERDGMTQVAFPSRARDVAAGTIGAIAGAPYRVVSVATSKHISGLVVLEAEPA